MHRSHELNNQDKIIIYSAKEILFMGGEMGVMLIWIVAIFGIMYVLMIRPQKKERQRVQAMLAEMAVGDTVLTTSGFYGVIIDITDEDVIVEFGNNKNCRIPMQRTAISQIEKPNVAKPDDK